MTRIKPIKKLILSVIVILLLSHMLSGCLAWGRDNNKYTGDYPEAYTIAVNSILGENPGPDTNIGVLERDVYSRIMFYYLAKSYETEYKWGVLICQKTGDGYVYYYPDDNYYIIRKPFGGNLNDSDLKEQTYKAISEEEFKQFKEVNDWNKEYEDSKMVKAETIWKKVDIVHRIVDRDIICQVYREICSNNEYLAYNCSYLTSDEYNRHIYFFRAADSDGENLNGYYVVLFNSDGTYNMDTGVMEVIDLNDYKSELKEFKEKNNWNNP